MLRGSARIASDQRDKRQQKNAKGADVAAEPVEG